MEIVNANCATLTDFEALKHLRKIKDSKIKHNSQLATITYETLRMLKDTPCVHQTPESIRECLKALAPFKLSKTEMLMMINRPPTSELQIQLIVEESEERLTEEQVEKLLGIIVKYFPHVAKEEPKEDEEPE